MMDNQQQTSWFCGLLEAEGCFQKSTHGGSTIEISNTDLQIVELCEDYLRRNFILVSRKTYKQRLKTEYLLVIQSRTECMNMINTLGERFQARKIECLDKLGCSTTTRDVTLTPDLHWLVGQLEGDGSIALGKMTRPQKYYYKPVVQLESTHENIIEKAKITLFSLGLPCFIHQGHSGNPKHRPYQRIVISGFKRVQRVLDKLGPLFLSDKYSSRAKLLKQFCDSALSGNTDETKQNQAYWDLRLKI